MNAFTSRPFTPQVIQDPGELPLYLYSDVRAPLASLSFLRRSLALAELAMISYNDEAEARRAARAIGFPVARLLDNDGSQVYWFANEHDVVIACRGTELDDWNDIRADANATMAVVGSIGRVHSGFNREVDDIWPLLEGLLFENRQPIWLAGHSLGGAMATICSYRCNVSTMHNKPRELHTFGSPRVGCKRYARHSDVVHYRWVHNNDIVTRVPPVWMGYRHAGHEIYLDQDGRIRNLAGFWRSLDRLRGLLMGVFRLQLDWLSDHSMRLYAQHIAAAVLEDEQRRLADDVSERLPARQEVQSRKAG